MSCTCFLRCCKTLRPDKQPRVWEWSHCAQPTCSDHRTLQNLIRILSLWESDVSKSPCVIPPRLSRRPTQTSGCHSPHVCSFWFVLLPTGSWTTITSEGFPGKLLKTWKTSNICELPSCCVCFEFQREMLRRRGTSPLCRSLSSRHKACSWRWLSSSASAQRGGNVSMVKSLCFCLIPCT